MSVESSLEGIEAVLLEMRDRLKRLEEKFGPEPTCLTYPLAAERLGVSLSKLKRMVRAKDIRTARVGKVPMIPISEIQRISTPPPERPKLEASKRSREWVDLPVGRAKR